MHPALNRQITPCHGVALRRHMAVRARYPRPAAPPLRQVQINNSKPLEAAHNFEISPGSRPHTQKTVRPVHIAHHRAPRFCIWLLHPEIARQSAQQNIVITPLLREGRRGAKRHNPSQYRHPHATAPWRDSSPRPSRSPPDKPPCAGPSHHRAHARPSPLNRKPRAWCHPTRTLPAPTHPHRADTAL